MGKNKKKAKSATPNPESVPRSGAGEGANVTAASPAAGAKQELKQAPPSNVPAKSQLLADVQPNPKPNASSQDGPPKDGPSRESAPKIGDCPRKDGPSLDDATKVGDGPLNNDPSSLPQEGDEKTREGVIAERKAKKLAKLAAKQKAPSAVKDDSTDPKAESSVDKADPKQAKKPPVKTQKKHPEPARADQQNPEAKPGLEKSTLHPVLKSFADSLAQNSTYPDQDLLTANFTQTLQIMLGHLPANMTFDPTQRPEPIKSVWGLTEQLNLLATDRLVPWAGVGNVIRQLKQALNIDPNLSAVDWLENFRCDQVYLAAESISLQMRAKLKPGVVIMCYSISNLIAKSLREASRDGFSFRVVVIDVEPTSERLEFVQLFARLEEGLWLTFFKYLLRDLASCGIRCSYVHLNAIHLVTLTLIDADSVYANGSISARIGSNSVTLAAKAHNIPVLACCPTYRFTERLATGVWKDKAALSEMVHASLLNGIVTELRILPCSSVSAVMRSKLSLNV